MNQTSVLHESPLTALVPLQRVKNKWLVCASRSTVYVDVVEKRIVDVHLNFIEGDNWLVRCTMENGSGSSLGVSIRERRRSILPCPIGDSGHWNSEVDISGDDPEIFTAFEESIQLFAMPDTGRVLVVQEHRRPV
ncbi:hypothetical protein NDI76_21745, partial [Halogeometricum sp. S1BR25-6]